MENLSFEPIKQEAWHLQIKEPLASSKRTIDKLSIAGIIEMYEQKQFLCDTCGKKLDRVTFSMADHIAHMINPMILWSCEDCLIDDMKSGRVIVATELT